MACRKKQAGRCAAAALALALAVLPAPAEAQRAAMEEAWKPMLVHEGVAFSYIFYTEADEHHDGVVVRLINRNDYAVRYRFTMVFRSETGDERTGQAEGTLQPGELKTGDRAGLFWIPFKDSRSVGEVGLRGWRVTRLDEGEA